MSEVISEANLRALCGVDDAALDRLKASLRAKLDGDRASDPGSGTRPRRRLVVAGAIAAGVVLAAVLRFLGSAGHESTEARPVARRIGADAPPTRQVASPELVLGRDARLEERPAAYDDDPGALGTLVAASDLGVLARVLTVTEDEVTITVEEILHGDPKLLESPIAADSKTEYACCRELAWSVGERCLLFLVRPAGGSVLEVYAGGSGKLSLPVEGLLELQDVRELVSTGTLDAARVATLVRDRGPSAAFVVESQLYGLGGAGAPLASEPVQRSFVEWLGRWGTRRPAYDRSEVLRVLEALRPEHLTALPAVVHDRLVVEYPLWSEGYEGWFHRLRLLQVLSRARDAWAGARIRELVLDADAGRTNPDAPGRVYDERRLRAYELLARYDAPDATERTWQLYRSMPEVAEPKSFAFTRCDVARVLLELDPERARSEVLAVVRDQRARGLHVWLDLALLCGDEGRTLAREVLADPSTLLWRYDLVNSPFRLVRERGEPSLLHGFQDVIRERAVATRVGSFEFRHWFELHLAAGGRLSDLAAATARWLRDPADADSFAAHQLILRVQELAGVRVLRWKRPTEAEYAAAALELATALERR